MIVPGTGSVYFAPTVAAPVPTTGVAHGPLPETDTIDEAAEAGRDNSETETVGDNRDTDPIAGGGLLGTIAESR